MDPTKSIHVDSLEEAHEEMYRLGWTDGLPVSPRQPSLLALRWTSWDVIHKK